jgi:hypothetical protein
MLLLHNFDAAGSTPCSDSASAVHHPNRRHRPLDTDLLILFTTIAVLARPDAVWLTGITALSGSQYPRCWVLGPIIGPAATFSLPDVGWGSLLTSVMLPGRLEILTVLVLMLRRPSGGPSRLLRPACCPRIIDAADGVRYRLSVKPTANARKSCWGQKTPAGRKSPPASQIGLAQARPASRRCIVEQVLIAGAFIL